MIGNEGHNGENAVIPGSLGFSVRISEFTCGSCIKLLLQNFILVPLYIVGARVAFA